MSVVYGPAGSAGELPDGEEHFVLAHVESDSGRWILMKDASDVVVVVAVVVVVVVAVVAVVIPATKNEAYVRESV
jgi:hypothetical protein